MLYCAAVLASILTAGSCQRENIDAVSGGVVTFTVTAPGTLDTRAIADGTNVNEVHYAVYKTNPGEDYAIDDSGVIDGPLAYGVVGMREKSATLKLDLLQDQYYTILFWAQVSGNDHYVITNGDLRQVSVSSNRFGANDETRAAFFQRHDFNTYAQQNYEVTLFRPFAQINLGTAAESLTPSQEGQVSGYTISVKKSEMTVKGLATSFNLLTGEAADEDVTFTFTSTDTPHVSTGETLDVNDVHYHYVGMNYLFVPILDKTVEVSYTITTDKGTISNTIANVPVKENYRTNIIGNLLTSKTDFQIIVDESFQDPDGGLVESIAEGFIKNLNGDYEVSTSAGLASAMNNWFAKGGNFYIHPGTYDLTDYVVNPPTIPAGITLNIYAEKPVVTRAALEGVTIIGLPVVNDIPVMVAEVEAGGSLLISGVDLEDEDAVFVGDNQGTVIVSDSSADDFIASGNEAVEADNVQDVAALETALLSDAKVVTFGGNVTGDLTIVQREGKDLVIDGAGYNFDGVITVNGNSRAAGKETLTLRNIKFATKGSDFTFITAPSKIGDKYNYSHNVTIENCTFTGNKTVGAANFVGTYNFVMMNCSANQMHSILQIQSCDNKVLVDNVTVENCKNGISFGNTAYPTLQNSRIAAEAYGVRADGNASRGQLVIENTSINAATPVVVRKMTTDSYNVTLGNDVELTTEGAYHVVFTNGQDDEAYVVPTGKWYIEGADDYMVFPREYCVSTWDELTAALVAGIKNITLAADVASSDNYQLQKDVTIDLNKKSMTLPMINIHTKTTIKNGTINGKVYARKNSEIVFDGVTFSGAVADNLSTEGHLAIQGGCKSLYAKDCLFSPTSVSGSQTKPLSFEGGSTQIKFENCEFKSSPYKKQVYLNSLSATGSIDFTNCNFNNKTPNIMFAAACPLTNLTMTGTTKLTSVTLEINRAKEALTEDDLAYFRTMISNNSFSSVRVFYAGGSSEYIK